MSVVNTLSGTLKMMPGEWAFPHGYSNPPARRNKLRLYVLIPARVLVVTGYGGRHVFQRFYRRPCPCIVIEFSEFNVPSQAQHSQA